jgi:hypothetical protein
MATKCFAKPVQRELDLLEMVQNENCIYSFGRC